MRKPRRKPNDRSDGPVVFSYLQHYTCFHCRKTFKQPYDRKHLEHLCPQCRQPMTNMGTDFKAPPANDLKQWQKVKLLAEAGVKFFPRWDTGGPGERPATLAEVPAFLTKVHPPSEGERLLTQFRLAPHVTRPMPEGRLEQHGSFPYQSYSLLGQALESGAALELLETGGWRPITFVSRGSGMAVISQPFALRHIGNQTYTPTQPIFLTAEHRLRWPPK